MGNGELYWKFADFADIPRYSCFLCPLSHPINPMRPIIFQVHFHGNYYAGDHIDIHDNSSVVINHGQKSTCFPSGAGIEDITPVVPVADDIPLFKYIHPSVVSDEVKRQIHGEVQNLVRQFAMTDICRYLR